MSVTVTRIGVTLYGADGKRIKGWGSACRDGTPFYRGAIAEALIALGFFTADRVLIDLWVRVAGRPQRVSWEHKIQAQPYPDLLDLAVQGLQSAIENLEERVE